MECRIALNILDTTAPDVEMTTNADYRSAERHVASCAHCQESLRGQREWDIQVGHAMRDISAPADLNRRLLAAASAAEDDSSFAVSHSMKVASASTVVESAATPTMRAESKQPILRKTLSYTVAAACLLICGAFWFVTQWNTATLTLDDLRESLPVAISSLPEFRGGRRPEIPGDGWPRIITQGKPKGYRPSSSSETSVALYPFRIRSRNGRLTDGVLLVVPKSAVIDAPTNGQFDAGLVVYAKGDTLATVAWTSKDFVYVCFVHNLGNGLRDIQRALRGSPT